MGEERPPQSEDFPDSSKQQSLHTLQTLPSLPCSPDQLPYLLILLCEHLPPPLCQEQLAFSPPDDSGGNAVQLSISPTDDSGAAPAELLWSSPEHRQLAETILSNVVTAEGVHSLEKLLDKDKILEQCLNLLRPRLEAWPENPASCHCVAVVATAASSSALSGALGQLLPIVLRWLDSWMEGPRVLGAGLASRILRGGGCWRQAPAGGGEDHGEEGGQDPGPGHTGGSSGGAPHQQVVHGL